MTKRGESLVSQRPLEGIRVLELSLAIVGPYTGQLLADAGAEVIKIERPDGGDISRSGRVTLFKDKKPCDGEMFLRYNRNKKSVCIDLKKEKGAEILLDLVKVSDVVVENFRPGVFDSMGITYELLMATNPRIIYCTCSGFGRSRTYQGPWSDRPSLDITVQAMSGMLDLVGEKKGPPMFTGIAFGDTIPPIFAAYAIMLALHKRERTGEGDFIDIAQQDCLMNTMSFVFTHYSLTGEMLSRGGEKDLAPWDIYKTSDGYVALLIMEGETHSVGMWTKFCRLIGKDEWAQDPRLANGQLRIVNRQLWEPDLKEWFESKGTDEVVRLFLDQGFPIAPVMSIKEIFEGEHLHARRMLIEVEHPEIGKMKLINTPVKLLSVPPDEYAKATPPPLLGEHTDEVLSRVLGFTQTQLNHLRLERVIK